MEFKRSKMEVGTDPQASRALEMEKADVAVLPIKFVCRTGSQEQARVGYSCVEEVVPPVICDRQMEAFLQTQKESEESMVSSIIGVCSKKNNRNLIITNWSAAPSQNQTGKDCQTGENNVYEGVGSNC